MANVYPLDVEQTYRQPAPGPLEGQDVTVQADGLDAPAFDPETGTIQIPTEDGSVTIAFGPPKPERKESDFADNLAEDLSEVELSALAEKILLGIEADSQSRSAWLENMSAGISLLGLETKTPRGAAASGSTPAEGVSTVDHPLLLEAVLRFQANALGELLPSDGPVKVRNDGEGNALSERLAQALEKDMNHYLTKVAKEYYPDTDRMLLMLGFSGISFKKGYHDPIKRRPVIASIDAKDLIVSNAATDIEGAGRVTHRIMMRPSTLRRMQLVGAYRDVYLPVVGTNPIKNPVDAKIDQVQGIAPPTYVDQEADQDRELFECYCEIEVPGYEHEIDGELTGLPLPYKVVIDKEARKILEIRRNWREDDEFCLARNRIIAYTFIPGLGFYGIGLLNVLGNSTKAVTAAWRLMIDAGMFANFPGFLYLKSLAKQLTNQFRIPPGGGMPIDTVGNDIRSSVMPLPYKDPSAVFIQLIDNIANAAQRVGGTAEMQVGEGKQDAPVGTTLALIEQSTKLMSAVHKRMHSAQGQEFDMLKELLMEDPEALWRHNKKSEVLKELIARSGQQQVSDEQDAAEERHRELFLLALNDMELIPRADPNTSSQTERYMKVVAMRQMAATNSSINLNEVDKRAFRTMGIDDPDSLMNPPPPPGSEKPAPEQIIAESTMIAAQARLQDSKTKAMEAQTKQQTEMAKASIQFATMKSREKIAALGVARELVVHEKKAGLEHSKLDKQHQHAVGLAGEQRKHDLMGKDSDTRNQLKTKALDLAHGLHTKGMDQAHQIAVTSLGHQASMQEGVANRQNSMFQKAVELRHKAEQADRDREHKLQLAKAKPKGSPAKEKK